jgi:hypothetical protein
MANTEKTIDEVIQGLEGLISIAPSIIAIIQTVKTNGSISLDQMNALMGTRQAAVAEADAALNGG